MIPKKQKKNNLEKETYNEFVKRKTNEYISLSLKTSSKISSFVSKLRVINKTSGEFFPVVYDFMNIQKDNYLWFNFVSTYMQNKAIKQNKKAVFVTLTLPSEFHKFKTLKNGCHVRNKKFTFLSDGYKKLNESFRHLYHNFIIDRKKVKTTYLRVIEPHKDFTPHLHGIIFLSEDEIPAFKNHLQNTIKTFSLGVQYDFEVLDSVQASVSYIMKYVKKSMFSENELSVRIIDGWKKENKIRMFTHSQISVKRYFFSLISKHIDLSSEGNYSILENFEKRVSVSIKYVFEGEIYREDNLFNSDSENKVYIVKEKIKKIDFEKYILISESYGHWTLVSDFIADLKKIDFDFIGLVRYYYEFYADSPELYYLSSDFDYEHFFLSMDFDFFKDLFENYVYDNIEVRKLSYKIKDFKIYSSGLCLYDKKEFELL